ncbi:hypothetical protein [Aquabacterium sp.]|uniref:hypothetical protein n=1 Tax=Aquabacterium sp. TaxID=1872578 RepID=UPI0025B9888C|nr:hypothetical protein [Aquabacterium sp.]
MQPSAVWAHFATLGADNGLKCGIIAAKYPGMDIVSFGPTIRGPHAPGESVDVASVARTGPLLIAVVAAHA